MKIGNFIHFYSLRPKWVKLQQVHQVCTCVYCDNVTLICNTLKNITGNLVQNTDLYSLYLCADASDECWLKECLECPRQSGISIQKLGLQETEDEITCALWENGDLIKKNYYT